MGCASPLSGDPVQVLYGNNSLHLDRLGLSLHDLNWGRAVDGVRIAALFVPTPASPITSPDEATLILAIANHAPAALVIPTINMLPHYFVYGLTEPRKELFHYSEAYGISSPSFEELLSGQTIIYTRNYSISGLRKRNEERDPMIFALKDVGLYDSSSPLYLESREVAFPKLP
jgi:hypothetical protein